MSGHVVALTGCDARRRRTSTCDACTASCSNCVQKHWSHWVGVVVHIPSAGHHWFSSPGTSSSPSLPRIKFEHITCRSCWGTRVCSRWRRARGSTKRHGHILDSGVTDELKPADTQNTAGTLLRNSPVSINRGAKRIYGTWSTRNDGERFSDNLKAFV